MFGGVNFIEFFKDKSVVNPLKIKVDVLNELQYKLLLCNTEKSRLSATIIQEQINSYANKDRDVVEALDKTKEIAVAMKNAFLLGNIDEVGYLLDEGWKTKKKFSTQITNPFIDNLYEDVKKKSVMGGKLLGAGGGGYLLLMCQPDTRHIIVGEFSNKISPVAFEFRGLQTWEVSG